jgi:hypothetical protein
MSVILNSPAVFRFTAQADPHRHLEAARLMGADVAEARTEDAREILAGAIIAFMPRPGMPNGLKAVGYTPEDADALVAGTIVQHRMTKLSPRPASEAELNFGLSGAAGDDMPLEAISSRASSGATRSERIDVEDVPGVVRAKGERAVRAYRWKALARYIL